MEIALIINIHQRPFGWKWNVMVQSFCLLLVTAMVMIMMEVQPLPKIEAAIGLQL